MKRNKKIKFISLGYFMKENSYETEYDFTKLNRVKKIRRRYYNNELVIVQGIKSFENYNDCLEYIKSSMELISDKDLIRIGRCCKQYIIYKELKKYEQYDVTKNEINCILNWLFLRLIIIVLILFIIEVII